MLSLVLSNTKQCLYTNYRDFQLQVQYCRESKSGRGQETDAQRGQQTDMWSRLRKINKLDKTHSYWNNSSTMGVIDTKLMQGRLKMIKTTPLLTFIVMGLLMISSCAPQKPDQANPVTPEVKLAVTAISSETNSEITPVLPTSTPLEPAADGQKAVTLDDQGKTISLAAGEDFLLKLGDVYTWEVNISDQNVLSRVKSIAVMRGAQGVYEAHSVGTATLSATGDPQCRQSQPPCGMPSIQFKITVVVK
jgi:hypothetical protein